MEEITIEIAGFGVNVRTDSAEQSQKIRTRYAAFLSSLSETKSLIDITLHVDPQAQYIPIQAGEVWRSDITIQDNTLHFTSYLEQGTLNLASQKAELTLAPNGEIENFLRTIYAWLCLQNDAIMLHSAGIIKNNVGYLFFGPSGAGKSTTSALSAEAGATVISDDIVILKPQTNGLYHLCGVPFIGEFSGGIRANISAPLRAIYRLHQDMTHQIKPLPRSIAIAELTASAPFVVQHSSLSDQVLDICTQIVNQYPVQTLHFKRDPHFWDIIEPDVAKIS